MPFQNRSARTALAMAVAATTSFAFTIASAKADAFTTNTAVATIIETGSAFTGTAARFTQENNGNGSFAGFGVLDFSSTALGIVPSGNIVSGLSDLTLTLADNDESFAVGGVLNVYASEYTGSLSSLRYSALPADQPSGIDSSPTSVWTGNLTLIGQIAYNPTTPTGSSKGTLYNTTVSFAGGANAALESYLQTQINTGGIIRLVVADNSATVNGDFEGTGNATTVTIAPKLTIDATTTTPPTTNAVLTVNGGNKTVSAPAFARVDGSASTTISLTNTASQPGLYTVAGVTGATGSASGTGSAGTDPLGGGNSTLVNVGINVGAVKAGSISASNPATATVTIHNASNASDSDITVTVSANQVVTDRFIDNVGTTAGISLVKMLTGTSQTTAVQLVTTNTVNSSTADLTSNSLTTVGLPAATTVTSTLTSAPTGDPDTATLKPGTDGNITFNDGSITETRSVTFTVPATAKGGLYNNFGFFEGYLQFNLTNMDTAIGASTTPTGRVYIETDIYQPALVTGSAGTNTFTLSNAAHTVNNVSISSVQTDIGVRSLAQVTSVSLTAQGGWAVDPGFVVGTNILEALAAGAAPVTAANFDPTLKLNGTYTGNISVGLQNDQSVLGSAAGDLGTKIFPLSAIVTGNSGAGSANILPTGSYAGYSISRGAGVGKNTTISFLGGTSPLGNTVSVAWADGVTTGTGNATITAASDKATVSGTGTDTYVVQLSYDPTVLTSPTSAVLASKSGSKFVTAAIGDGGTTKEIAGGYNGVLTLGDYGIDTTNHVVWAVVDFDSDFEAVARLPGDTNGDGQVNISDLNAVASAWQQPETTYAAGDVNGDGVVNIADLNIVAAHWQFGAGSGSGSSDATPSIATPNIAVPEPASLSLLAAGGLLLTGRRRRRV